MSTANIIGNAIFGLRNKSGGNYINPAVKESLVGLWKFDQNTNESPTRNIIKNTIKGKGGDLELLNFAYKANSGYNGYPEDFTSWNYNTGLIVSPTKVQNNGDARAQLIYYYTSIRKEDVLEFKVKITLDEQSKIKYYYIKEDGTGTSIIYSKSGTYTIPTSYFSKYTGENTWYGFAQMSGSCIIEQLPLYEGALVTDGKDDMIVSQKTVQEMGITDEITVVSMIHQIGIRSEHNRAFNNYIRNQNVGFIRNSIARVGIDKTGIYGYTWNNSTKSLINKILGDKNDYSIEFGVSVSIEGKFTVEGYINNGSPDEISGVAVYWTFISNKVLTTDEINQIIAYFKLDKYVTPQVIYDVKRQGLTNDTPAADWYLKDFSGNGHDMQLYNYAKKGNSGIGKYETELSDTTIWIPTKETVSSPFSSNYNGLSGWIIFANSKLTNSVDIPSFKIQVKGLLKGQELFYRYYDSAGQNNVYSMTKDGEYALPADIRTAKPLTSNTSGFEVVKNDTNSVTITQIPDYEGALVSDGKDDYGQFVGDLGLKDYTIAVDRAYVEGLGSQVPIISSIGTTVNTPFLMEHMGIEKILAPHSFGTYTALSTLNTDRFISYQSTYKYNGDNLTKGTSTDTGSGLTIGRFGAKNSQYAKLALWSFLLFPYSLSEFLLERQLKKYKLGTLYPDMVEFRPVISGNIPSNAIEISQGSTTLYNKSINKTGIYLQEGSTVRVYIQPSGIDEVSKITINGVEYTDLPINHNGYYYADFPITKSPQKIDFTIDEYIRFEDIVQPYPEIWTITQNGNKVSWGDKLKVGSEFGYNSKVNLLSDVYTTTNSYYNGKVVKEGNILKVEKQMTFACDKTWKLNTTEPHAIYSPQKLNIPNSSLKILGYVPDLTGKGNHGKLNNFAYTEDSGVAADGSIKFDGTDDHITIPTLSHGGKCVMMKVNWSNEGTILYDQRLGASSTTNPFAIYIDRNDVAYQARNISGLTYIDGVLNKNIIGHDLANVTHNIIITNEEAKNDNSISPLIGKSNSNSFYSDMSLYEFMLFPEIPSEDEIKKLNDVMGIEENVFLIHLKNDTEIINETLILNE